MESQWKVDFIGIGPMKAGTTWLGHVLGAHPQICMSEPKEVHYFNDSISINKLYSASHYPLGEEWYSAHFNHCKPEASKGEITPRYLIDPVVPARLYQYNPDLKILVCLRDPFARIVSHYHSAHDFHKREHRSIHDAIRQHPEYIDASRYYKHIRHFLEYFSLDQLHFIDIDQSMTHPETVVRELYKFLEVDVDFLPPKLYRRSNPGRSTRSVALRKLTVRLHRAAVSKGFSPLIIALKKLGLGKLINDLNSLPLQKVSLTMEDKQFIREQLQADVNQFAALINRDLSHWLS